MNLLQSDVLNARSVLQNVGVEPGDVSCGWHNGHISLIVKCDASIEIEVLDALLHRTSIGMSIAVLPKEEKKTFKFNFKAS